MNQMVQASISPQREKTIGIAIGHRGAADVGCDATAAAMCCAAATAYLWRKTASSHDSGAAALSF